jgi:hypothetical protein
MMLYKYTKAKWGIAILRELRLKVSSPKEFNDPFEFTPTTLNPIASLDHEKLVRLNDWLHQQGFEHSSIENLQKILPVLTQNNPTIKNFAMELVNSDMAARDESSDHFGVLCLSEPRTDIRMWAHYGDENRGVAVGLDFDNETSGIGGVVCFDRVEYDNCRPSLNPMLPVGEEFHNQMMKIIKTKSKEWSDEREWRVVFKLEDIQKEQRDQGGPPVLDYFVHIRPETIREVIMGCFISESNEQTIRGLCKAKLPWANLFKLRRHDTDFELVPTPISVH